MNVFDEEYFMRGAESGKSNFSNYHWLPDTTISTATHLKRYLGLKEGDSLLDVGAARGFYVKAMRMLGISAWGYDVSEWAVENCDPDVRSYMSNHLNGSNYDVVFSKDTFEHIPETELRTLVTRLLLFTKRRMFVIVPLSSATGGAYIHPKEEKDKTHVNRWTLPDWLLFFQECSSSFTVSGSYLFPGLKPGAYEVSEGYGFFTIDRI